MLKNKQPMPVNIRATMQQQQLASARNRRLAQQMENRPSVQAALKLKQVRAPGSWALQDVEKQLRKERERPAKGMGWRVSVGAAAEEEAQGGTCSPQLPRLRMDTAGIFSGIERLSWGGLESSSLGKAWVGDGWELELIVWEDSVQDSLKKVLESIQSRDRGWRRVWGGSLRSARGHSALLELRGHLGGLQL